jgi:hypothetical protein
MSLDISVYAVVEAEVFEYNITHNLNTMAQEAGVYQALWRPEELFAEPKCSDVLPILEVGLTTLKVDEARYKQFNPANGWGDYDNLVECVERYIAACKQHPNGRITVSR